MKRNAATTALPALACAALCASALAADDWPGWLGAERGVVTDGTPPTEWDEETNVRWKVAIPGRGLSSPVVVDGMIYLTTAVPTKRAEDEAAKKDATDGDAAEEGADGARQRGGRGGRQGGRGMAMTAPAEHEFRVMALDHATGEVKWSRAATTLTPHEGTHADGSFATPTVAVAGDRVVASFGSFGIFTYDKKGELVWSVDLGDMSVRGGFGEGTSPVIAGGNVVILWGQEGDSFLVALDAASGEEVWSQPRATGTNWSSPTVARVGDEEQVIVVGESTQAYDAASGDLVWSVGGDGAPKQEPADGARGRRGGGSQGGPIATPLVVDGLLYTAVGGRRGSIVSIDIESDAPDDGLESERILWMHEGDTPGIPTPLVVGDTLFVTKGNTGILGAFDSATGKVHYTGQRLDGVADAYASPVAAGGNIYLTGRDGTFEVVRAGTEFQSIAVNKLDDRFDATPAIVGDTLLLRGFEHLYCIAADGK